MSMCVQKTVKYIVFSAILITLSFSGCDAVDNILPSNAYKVNAYINDIPLDECSYISFTDLIKPYFEEDVSDDPDVLALLLNLRGIAGDVPGMKFLYILDKEDEDGTSLINGDETVVRVNDFDELPYLLMPNNLPVGRYTLIFQVMSNKNILQKNENHFFYTGNSSFSFDGIQVYLPGIAESLQIIPKGITVMLEAKVNFDSHLDPYIVWYNGKRKISEGNYSQGAWQIFWEAPEQSGFYTLRAEVFPFRNNYGLAGFITQIPLLVSSKSIDINLISENVPQLSQWYVFNGNLLDSKSTDSKSTGSEASFLMPAGINKPVWMSANGTYGLAAGCDNAFTLPDISFKNNRNNKWQILFRFMPLNEGELFSVFFESDVSMTFGIEGENFVLTLISPARTVSQYISLPEYFSFITAGITFSIHQGVLSADLNIMGNSVEQNLTSENKINLNANIDSEFKILLGSIGNNFCLDDHYHHELHEFTALWDEFAIYYMPPMEIIAEDIKTADMLKLPETDDAIRN